MKQILGKLPYSIKQPIKYLFHLAPASLVYGKEYIKTFDFLKETEKWSEQKLLDYQFEMLSKILNYAFEYVPYYKKLFNSIGFVPSVNFKDFDDIKEIPHLTKELIRNNVNDLVSTQYNRNGLYYYTTGGSSGVPLGFYGIQKQLTARELAFIHTLWRRVGFEFGDKVAVLRGNILNKNIIEMDGNKLILSTYHLSESNFQKYINKLRSFKPKFLHVYPSSVFQLARYIIDNKIEPIHSIKAILAGSENVYDHQRKIIEDAFDCRLYSWYGHTEMCALAGECEKSDYYHIFSEYGYTEIINEKGDVCSGDGELGEVVATGFNNLAFPFIRYKTQDIGEYTNEVCSCGRHYKLIKRIQGREQDYIVTNSNKKITLVALIFAQHFHAFGRVKSIQIEQRKIGELIVRIVKNVNYSKTDEREIEEKILKLTEHDVTLSFEYVDEIKRTERGKYKFLVQHLIF